MMIRNIWAVGRNYVEHAKEMSAPVPTEPLIFLKAGSCASINSNEIEIPYWATEVHHEVELALKLGPQLNVIEGAIALDLTERKLQNLAKQKGEPWTLSKSFQGACAVSAFFTARDVGDWQNLQIRLWVNDELKQAASTAQMIFSCKQLLDNVMEYFPVCAGDLILTGTPAGVGPLKDGDRVRAEVSGLITHNWKVRTAPKPAAEPTAKK
jgi:acylpyruvate hydrolase